VLLKWDNGNKKLHSFQGTTHSLVLNETLILFLTDHGEEYQEGWTDTENRDPSEKMMIVKPQRFSLPTTY